jgi:hypothetical protein
VAHRGAKTDGVRRATHDRGLVTVLSGDPNDPKQTEGGELLVTQGKIAEKALKFPLRSTGRHVILVDTRAYLDHGADPYDTWEMVYGRAGLAGDRWHLVGHVWGGAPVKGLLNPSIPLRDAPAFRERVHFVGFVRERRYKEGEIRDEGRYLANCHFFTTEDAFTSAFRSYPLRARSDT